MILPKGKEAEEKRFDIKRFLNKHKRLVVGGIVSVLFLAKLIPYFILIICFLVLVSYKKNEKTEVGTKKRGISEMIIAYIKEQYETNPRWIFWAAVFVILFVITPLVFSFILVVISLIFH